MARRSASARAIWATALLCVGIWNPVRSQDLLYSVSVKGSFTSSSRLFYNVEATDEFSRSQYLQLDDVFGAGIEIRRFIENTRLQIGVSVEYLSAKESGSLRVGATRVPVEDGYWTVPIELGGYFVIPFSSEMVLMYIGGGVGAYIGGRRYAIANERADIVDSEVGYGIHVATGLEYRFVNWLGVRSEVKFRDLQFESSHAFSKPSVIYNGVTVQLRQTPTRSRINVDGMLLDVGLVVRF